MNKAQAVELISIALRDQELKDIKEQINQLKKRADKYREFDVKRVINYFFPFETETMPGVDGVKIYQCRGGSTIGMALQTARELARLMNEPVSFEFNKRITTIKPDDKGEGEK